MGNPRLINGGAAIADVLRDRGTEFLFTLCGGHISPILAEASKAGVRVIDVRDEANAVFAADAMARLTGRPGVAAVTAGPGLTNTITALQNAMMAQSPVVLFGGAAATMLKGRGALQDIDQLGVVRASVKWSAPVRYAKDLPTVVEQAFDVAASGVPGPVFVECPIDLLYDREEVRKWYLASGASTSGKKPSLQSRAVNWYLERHVERLFEAQGGVRPRVPTSSPKPPLAPLVARAKAMIRKSERPVMLIGSQALSRADRATAVAAAVRQLGIPVYLASGARGLLGRADPLQCRHRRKAALREADLVILAGVPCDFRLDYGRAINRKAKVIAANLSMVQLFKNRVPSLPVPANPGAFIERLAAAGAKTAASAEWMTTLANRDAERDAEIAELARQPAAPAAADRLESGAGTPGRRDAPSAPPRINPLQVCLAIEAAMDEGAVVVGDGGDFVATASYVVRPRGPLKWLDPGAYGTLGVGAAFAAAAKLAQPESEVWLLYGDGAAGFSIVEFDTLVRHQIPVIAVVGNDAGWTQIARDQVVILGDDIGTVLARTRYDRVAMGYGAVGLHVDRAEQLDSALAEAKRYAALGRPVVVNVNIGVTEFRKGSISM